MTCWRLVPQRGVPRGGRAFVSLMRVPTVPVPAHVALVPLPVRLAGHEMSLPVRHPAEPADRQNAIESPHMQRGVATGGYSMILRIAVRTDSYISGSTFEFFGGSSINLYPSFHGAPRRG